MQATNSARLKFAFLWANHDQVNMLYFEFNMRIEAPLKIFSQNGRISISGFQTPKWMALSVAALLGLAATVQGRLEIVNGDFSDLTGLTQGSDGWYSGLPKGWIGTDGT